MAHGARRRFQARPARERQARKRERGIWQPRYWARAIVAKNDFAAHLDCAHINPVKHGRADRVSDWPWSTVYGFVRNGRSG
jgi:putative transposase